MSDEDQWFNEDKHDLPEVSAAVDDEAANAGQMCGATEMVTCTRGIGHAGRHIAMGTERPIAAWPGWGRPTLADMTAEPVSSRALIAEGAGS